MQHKIAILCILSTLAFSACASEDENSSPSPDTSVEPAQGLCVANEQDFPKRPAASPATLPPVHQQGVNIVDDAGNIVALRGVNAGSWLMLEPWIAGIGLQHFDFLEAQAMFTDKAEELGCPNTIADALDKAILGYFLESLTYIEVLETMRQHTYDNPHPGEEAAIDSFWTWWDEIPWIHAEQDLWRYLAGRFGWNSSQKLRSAFQDAWFSEKDFADIAALGLNTIRLPFWYDVLESDDAKGAYFRPEGWQRIHDALEWARTYKLYIILDMHGTPGGQSREPHCGTSDGNKLWGNDACIAKTARLWKALAAYVRDDPHVAALDLMNEPMDVPDRETYEAALQPVYDAVRSVNTAHMVMFEDGYLPADRIPSPVAMGWENYMYSIHLYPGGDSPESMENNHVNPIETLGETWAETFNCPLLVGEFALAENNSQSLQGMERVLSAFNRMGVHWTPWTYKFWDKDSLWGVLHGGSEFEKIDVATISFEDMMARMQAMHSDNFEVNQDFAAIYQTNALTPAVAQDLHTEIQGDD